MIDAESWDVVIVGGGPVGVAAAIQLAARSAELAARTLLLDRPVFPRPNLDHRRRIATSAVGYGLKRSWLGAGYFYRLLRESGTSTAPVDGPH